MLMREFCCLTESAPVFFRNLLAEVVALLESVNTSACINKLLLSGKEGMALGADFYSDVLLCGTCGYFISAGTSDNGSLICGMNSFLHLCHLNPCFLGNPRRPVL